MIRILASLLCQALLGLALGLFVANLAHAHGAPPAPPDKLARTL